MTTEPIADIHATITPEKVAAMKERIGTLQPGSRRRPPPFPHDPDLVRIKDYCTGIGEDNPLFCDPNYAATTRWRSVIAPPTFNPGGLYEEPPPGMVDPPRGDPLRGLHSFAATFEMERYRPIFAGDRTSSISWLDNVEEKQSQFSARSVRRTYASRHKNQRGEIVKVGRYQVISTERGTASERKKYVVERHKYSAEEIAAIDEAYEAEQRRGNEPRYWEDVEVGDELPQMVKGPYTLTDYIGYCIGTRMFGAYGDGPFRIGYKNRKRIPAFYFRDEYGVPLSSFASHHDASVAAASGNPLPYDLGAMRDAWLCQLVTNWIGDDGWLFKSHIEIRRFNYLGDTQWCRGSVTGKRREGDLNMVDIEMYCINQRGEITTPGSAVVLLPSREFGSVRLPDPPREYER
jgi:acyl dehydratase